MRKQIASPFITPSSPFGFSKFQLCCRIEKREKAVNKDGGWKLSREKSNFRLELCAFQNGNATLIKLPIKQTIQGNKMVFRGLEGGEEAGQREETR